MADESNDNNDGGAVRAATADPISLKDVTRAPFTPFFTSDPIDYVGAPHGFEYEPDPA